MRELKFRAWKKPNGIEKGFMYFPERLFLNSNGKVWHIDGEKFSNSYVLEHGFAVLMQYTGLKDKNSVEIYEGDIVKHPLGIIAEIIYDESGAFVAHYKHANAIRFEYLTFIKSCEIIGNIYEHPHLLEVSS